MGAILYTGAEKLVIPFDRGSEEIYINAGDADFYGKIEKMAKDIMTACENSNLEDIPEGGALEVVTELNNNIKECFIEALGEEATSKIFKYASPTAIVKQVGLPFVFYFLDFFYKELEKISGKTSDEIKKNVDAALKKYGNKYAKKL